jgi:hypothetical protein
MRTKNINLYITKKKLTMTANLYLNYSPAGMNGAFNINPVTSELNPFTQRRLTKFLVRILLLEPCISLIYA